MKQFATISLIGRDRSGVIAAVTQLLFEHGANIEALEEQVTRGQFNMTLQASWKEGDLRLVATRKAMPPLAKKLGMQLTFQVAAKKRLQRMAIFVTKEPHAPEGILKAVKAKKIKAEASLMIGNRPDLKKLAARYKIPFIHVPYPADRSKAEERILKILQKHEIDFLALARFMKILSPNFVWRWKNKIINIHPSLLPSFPGSSAYRQAYEKGVKIIGVTAHFVTPDLDQGPIICQDSFKVRPDETLASITARGQQLESKTLIHAVQLFLQKRLDVHWGRVYGA